ncbi:MAG: NYN domain-containing protein [Rhizobiaceae bacterium]|jgi:uncharacterized LabA/DUF88 family protein
MVTHNERTVNLADYIYIDFSNLAIGAQQLSAVHESLAPDLASAMANKIFNRNHKLDVRRLCDVLVGDRKQDVARLVLFGSRLATTNDAEFLRVLHNAGFENNMKLRKASNGEKQVDTSLVVEMMVDALQISDRGDPFTLVAGDSDYVPMIKKLTDMNIHVDVMFWDHASQELQNVCSNFVSLNPHLDLLTHKSSNGQI